MQSKVVSQVSMVNKPADWYLLNFFLFFFFCHCGDVMDFVLFLISPLWFSNNNSNNNNLILKRI